MKALIMNPDRSVQMVEKENPELLPGTVILDVVACGICGTDMHICHGMECSWAFPITIGHEFSGIISSIADDVTGFKIGDKVVVETLTNCGKCEMCKTGRKNLCFNPKLLGGDLPGGFADQVRVPFQYLIPIPANVSAQHAAIAEPLATVVHGLNRLIRKKPENVVVFGAGAIGLLAFSMVKSMGSRVAVSDISEKRLEIAKDIGAASVIQVGKMDVVEEVMKMTGGKKVDLCIDAAGFSATRGQAFDLIKPGGEILCIALGDKITPTNYFDIVTKELTIYGTQCHTVEDFYQAMDALDKGLINCNKIITTYPLEKGEEVFQALAKGDDLGIKIHLTI